MRILLTLCLFVYSTFSVAKAVSISVQGMDKPLNCRVEESIGGYFCLDGKKFLIIRDFGNSVFATGDLEDGQGFKNYTINKVYSELDSSLLYERAPSPFDNMSFGDFKGPPESLNGKISKLSIQISNFENNYKTNQSQPPQSDEFANFLKSKLAALVSQRDKLSRDLEGDSRIVEFENGDKIRCQRLSQKKKSQDVIDREKRFNETVRCGVFNCGADSKGNKRLLVSHFSPGQDFADMLYLSEEGPVNGSKMRRILSPKNSVPISDFSHFLDVNPQENNTFFSSQRPEIESKAFVPESLKDQSSFFKKIDSPNYEMILNDSREICAGTTNKEIDKAFERHREKRAEADLVQYITILNNQLQGHFLPEQGIPKNACFRDGVYYNPDAIKLAQDTRPSIEQKAISIKKAQELFNYAKAMDDIAWNYKGDGCYARAHLMARRFEEKGIHVDKAWLKGDLNAPVEEGETPTSWNFHVAPVVYVKGEDGSVEKMIIDPSTFDAPVSSTVWQTALSNSDHKVEETSFPFPTNSLTYSRTSIAFSNSDPYLDNDAIGMTETEKMSVAESTMKRYKEFN